MKAKPIFVYFLALAALSEIVLTILSIALKIEMGRWILALTLMIMGAGLIVESQIRTFILGGYKFDEAAIFGHLITGIIGVVSLILGFVLMPMFNIAVVGGLLTFTVAMLIFQAIAIVIETFII